MAKSNEFRYRGVKRSGEKVQGTVFAPSKSGAKEKVTDLSEEHKFRFREEDIQKRKTYKYKVKHPNGETVKGEQKAFTKEEVKKALANMDMEVQSVTKKWELFNFGPPRDDVIMFVRLAANLLSENLRFDEVLELLVDDVNSDALAEVLKDLRNDLKEGMDPEKAFKRHRSDLGPFVSYMLGIAGKSGNMAEIYQATARFLERKDEFRKNVRSAMLTPAITTVILIGCTIWYVWYIIPATVGLFEGMDVTIPPLTAYSLAFAEWLDVWWMWVLAATLLTFGGIYAFFTSERGKLFFYKHMRKIPVLGPLLHKLNVEIFCRVFAVLYSGAGDNIRVIRIAAEACGNTYIEKRVKSVTIPMMVARGEPLVDSLEAADVFTNMTISRFRSGAKTGNVQGSAEQMANYYENETSLKLESAVSAIQTGVAMLITVALLFLTLLSTEMAFMRPDTQSMMGG